MLRCLDWLAHCRNRSSYGSLWFVSSEPRAEARVADEPLAARLCYAAALESRREDLEAQLNVQRLECIQAYALFL